MAPLWKKSILFELSTKSGKGLGSFTLTIPPESFDIEEVQRTSQTNTFGGLFVDDYGPGIYKINISGDTGNSTARETFAPKGDSSKDQKYSGRDAFFYFRDKIMRYKDPDLYYTEGEEIVMKIYDLSSVPEHWADAAGIDYLMSGTKGEIEAYEVILNNFKMKRDKSKPLFYQYSIEMTGVRPLGTYSSGLFVEPIKIPSEFSILGALRSIMANIQRALNAVRAVMNTIDDCIDMIDQVTKALTSFYNQIWDLIMYPAHLIAKLKSNIKTLADTIESLPQDIKDKIGMTKDAYLDVLGKSRNASRGANSLSVTAKTQSQNTGSKGVPNNRGIRSTGTDQLIREGTNESVSTSMMESGIMPSESTDLLQEESQTNIIYGYDNIELTNSDTLLSLSQDFFGSPNYMDLIAMVNEIKGDDDLVVGDVIKIPILKFVGSGTNGAIYSNRIDPYGTDIKLDVNGNPMLSETNDWVLVTGEKNVVQALNLRLNELLGSRIRLTVYGIAYQVGSYMSNKAPMAYAVASLKDTVIQDPRIKKINTIQLYGKEDAIFINMDLQLSTRSKSITYRREL